MKLILLEPARQIVSAAASLVLALWFTAFNCNVCSAGSEGQDAFAQCQKLGRGVNVLGYDPIWESPGKARFQERHFGIIKAGGFDTLRVNLYPFRHMGPGPDFRLSDQWWHTTDWVVAKATNANLNVILDLHEYEAMGNDAEGGLAKFLAFWQQVAPHFQNAPSSVLFEILNEPHGKLTPPIWNQYLAEALAVIRSNNPARMVIVGPAFYNSIRHLDELELPDSDRNLIVTVHYYDPMDFTHQGAAWAGRKDKLGVEWKGTPEERTAIAVDFQKAQDWGQHHNRPIFLGEFGAYDKGDMASRARYTACVARTAEHLGWSWAYWQFDSDFIVYDISKDQWVEPIHNALVPPPLAAASETNRQ